MKAYCVKCQQSLTDNPTYVDQVGSIEFTYDLLCCDYTYTLDALDDTPDFRVLWYSFHTSKYRVTFYPEHPYDPGGECTLINRNPPKQTAILTFNYIIDLTPENADQKIPIYLTFS